MKVLLDMAISLNGFIAREDGDEDWLPSEGWDEFLELAKRLDNIVMGRETYEQVTARYKDYNFNNVKCRYKVIVTRDTSFKAIDGYLIAHSPEEAIELIASKGLDELFLIGGGKLNSEFIKRKLVNTIQLTINPYIVGKGRSFIAPEDFDLPLKPLGHKELSKGRVQLIYSVLQS
jgi:dihydrofolate reductase